MLDRSEFKKRGKNAYYRNWRICIIICFIYTIFIGGTVISLNKENNNYYPKHINEINIKLKGENNSDIVNEFINGIKVNNKTNELAKNSTEGILGSLVNNVSKSGSYLFGILNAINQILFHDHIWASIIIIVGAVLSLFYWIFISKVLEVGYARFYLENRKYTKTKANKLLLPYRINKTTIIAYTMFLKNLYTLLWSFTIIGPFIKYYEYYFVSFILAENPNLNSSTVLKLSKEMTKGYKWQLLKFDLSFIGWRILGYITLNISNIVFTEPYINATKAEIYMYLRELSKTKGIKNANKLSDVNLEGGIVLGEYPAYEYMLKAFTKHKWLNFNYKRDYSLWNLILLFFIFSSIGWIWEVLLHLFQYGNFVNRGTLYGPWLPIYGAGAIIFLTLLKKYRQNPYVYFVLCMFIAGIIEYCTSIYLELVHNLAWWDYTGFFLNLNGRICLEGLIVFGIGGVVVTYIAAPFISNFLDKINKNYKAIICVILILFLACDFYISNKKPNTGQGITTTINNKSTYTLK